MIKKLFAGVLGQREQQRRADMYRGLIRREAKIGGQVFGKLEPGRNREFFCLDEHTWVWHEEWTDQNGNLQHKTTHYDLRPNGLLKSQNGHYQAVSYDEAARLLQAVNIYNKRVSNELYNFAI